MTKLYLIRHAEAEGNVFRRMHGQYNSSITPNGMRQIEALQKRFENVPVDAVYASDLIRACTTAGAIYRPKGLPLQKDSRFREVRVGVWEDVPFGLLDREDPERNRAFSKAPQTWSVEGSETYEEYTGRFLEALDEVARRHDGQSVAVFSHGMVMRAALARLFFGDDAGSLPHSENTAVTTITWENGRYHLESLFDASHISPEIATLGRQLWWRGEGHRDMNLWFRPADGEDRPLFQALGYAPCPEDRAFVSYLENEAAGAVFLRSAGAGTGGIAFLGLLPEYRGLGLAAQLLGCAVSEFRKEGQSRLVLLQAPPAGGAERFFARFDLQGPEGISLIPVIR